MGKDTKLDYAERERRWQKAREPWMKQIVTGLVLGNLSSSYTRELLKENHIDAIVSLDVCRTGLWIRTSNAGVTEERHKFVQCADSSTQDLLVHLDDICDFIDQVASPALTVLAALPNESNAEDDAPQHCEPPPSQAVLVHCELGISRSPTIIIAYLMRKLRLPRAEVLGFVRAQRKVKPSANFTRQLEGWEEVGYQLWEDEARAVPKALYTAFLDDRAARLAEMGLTGDEPLAPLTLD
ncbi:hypothetical protein N7462_003952 [Penicillium macrosclerotiorum]|uniref:uncharacterized protein n=1 Tax=Penicillium macrosclerotiorum TaxID=303699 RepID=UPI002548FF50|nr:uncharacterized protein N7462_003952 [Penicillium macrosclerotiorum]KAJ5689560.1 hypothetical protein N7462_003952 [Penicillium macrosclerotiorum]